MEFFRMFFVAAIFLLSAGSAFGQPSGTDDVFGDCACKCCKGDACDKAHYSYVTFMSEAAGGCTETACRAQSAQCPDEGSHNSKNIVMASSIDCACSCCMNDECPHLTTQLMAAGGRERCTPERCSASFARCPDAGSHHDSAEVYAEFFDCTCECCDDPDGCTNENATFMRYAAGTAAGCSAAQCSARFQQCPDSGSHNDGTIVLASYSGPDYGTGDHSCDCACCKAEDCLEGRPHFTFFAQDASQCTRESCSANFAQCPDAGSHNSEDEIFATFYDCKCSCCSEASCPVYTTNLFVAGTPEACTPEQCSARFASCPDAGAHNSGADVQAVYNALVDASVVVQESPSGGMSTGGVIGIIVAMVVLALALVMVGVYVWAKKAKGYKWMSEEEMNKLTDVTATKTDADPAVQMAAAESNGAHDEGNGRQEDP
mmetsp:Transcript_7555/g.21421  ORF Transcript_7555/g.21421 Transcript_7555/m.21421 type:complete len:430 (-) Transcript_7555:33-1322(-)|eukprot:CAMPEP_0117662156 /NCGR_PEP_ID=MMETSP0804-20121206/7908_1 /TAXON_ID=1074897 /ORGANISM="Tetraselmis astigmatica, Strain CCMP880" /LENGTH=429 /DNA_ID=CAMNT_0005469047 /DNA_START=96 /DNA_END=1385 /DNA_ORIENTATION=-